MTTIAFDGNSISYDSQSTIGGNKDYTINKIIEGLDFFIGCAGYEFQIDLLRRGLLKKGTTFKSLVSDGIPLYPTLDDNLNLLLIGKYEYTDSYYICAGGRWFLRNPKKEAAIGSGGFLALSAMMAGADSRRAVQIAAELDLYTGGEIHTRFLID